jgi:hypothetical protein
MSLLQITGYQEKVIKELSGLSSEKIDEVIDFICFLKSKETKRKRKKNIRSDIRTEVAETEEDRQAYTEALQELESGDTLDFEALKSAWLKGQSANV